ncbi:hypothetical protein PVK06_044594 [Gossypium arboreum]|uniref:Uncharacterized protein n=1 Tax=Gossypium arboreum TaxID=29729 RepID=A0ABR0MRN8_GOSAR|nr:hypothetical protein PVK06_044594 [Gossypium arboreum]
MEGEESFEQFSPEIRIKDPRNREAASFLPPIKLFHGTSDYSIPSDANINLVEALTGVGAEVKVILYEGKSHTDLFLQGNESISRDLCELSSNYLKLYFKTNVMGLLFGVLIISLNSPDADGASLPPEEKPKLCDDACEKELEKVCVKDTVDKLRSDARQEFKTKLNIEDCMVPGREKKQKERSKNSSSVSEVMNIDEDASSTTAESCFGAAIKILICSDILVGYVESSIKKVEGSLAYCPDESVVYEALNFALSSERQG